MNDRRDIGDWLPVSREELERRGWDAADVIVVTGDAYVDHPAFGHAVIGRVLESEGWRVAILPQPNWRDDLRDFRKLGRPRLFFGVTSGCMDSMVNHYTARKRLRSDDAYSPGGEAGFRPDYATIVYSKILKKLYPDVPVVIGGIEASLRRFTHYDYWSDTLKPTILADSGADLLVYGMGEEPSRRIAELLGRGTQLSDLHGIRQTAVLVPGDAADIPAHKTWKTQTLASHEDCLRDKRAFAENFRKIELAAAGEAPVRLVQTVGDRVLVVNPPFPVMSEKRIDSSFDLPYTRRPHPRYKKRGAIPAYEMIRFSINIHRGCFGGCSFCAIAVHQGKRIAGRSKRSILREVDAVSGMPDFSGTITDLGGPTANMYGMKGRDRALCCACSRPSCLHPRICANLDTDHGPLLEIYESVRAHPAVRHVFVGSGIRHDLLVVRPEEECKSNRLDAYLRQLVRFHVSGRLKVAPEHTSEQVLALMRKPSFRSFEAFKMRFDELCDQEGIRQQLVPYFVSAHPGCTLEDMADLALRTKRLGYRLEQVQDFTPTPMTLATAIFYSGLHPYTGARVSTVRTAKDRAEQHRFFFWRLVENRSWIRERLLKMGRMKTAVELFEP